MRILSCPLPRKRKRTRKVCSSRSSRKFELIKEYLAPVLGGIIIDASCASGVFSRLFAKSGLFSLVFALDFSETMLQQCYEFITQDENFPTEKIILVRADISRLPFASGSVDAVHAGAALHCWPSPSLVASVKVLAIFCDEDKVRRAGPGENLRVRLSGVEEEEILSGFVLCSHGTDDGASASKPTPSEFATIS